MVIPALTQGIDVGMVVTDTWVLAFFALIIYLRREDMREGYPLISERTGRPIATPFLTPPAKKTFLFEDGSTVTVPRETAERVPALKLVPGPVEGAASLPTGNPLIDAVGPASYAQRADHPEQTWEGENRLQPLRIATGWSINQGDPDPRGWGVVAADGISAGTVKEAWVDVVEPQVYYWEVASTGGRIVLVPARLAVVDEGSNLIRVESITAAQFANVPAIKNPNEVTLLEEDKITGYFAGGKLYALPARREPLI
jgi:photosynthetic reaction center H subunit